MNCEKTSYSDFAYIYDALTDDVEYEKRADYVQKLFDLHSDIPVKLVCDLACGTGTICRILNSRGYDMIGIDNSADMLNVAYEKSEGGILYLNQDICDFELYGTVDAFLCMLDSVNYLIEDNDLKELFSLVNNYLNPGGVFIFDINTPYKFKNILGNKTYNYENDNIFYTWENNFDGEFCDLHLNFFVKNENELYERITETHTQRMYEYEYINTLINQSGLTLINVYNDLTLSPLKPRSSRAVYVVKKC